MTYITQEVEKLAEGRYDPRELKLLIGRKRRKRVPTSTWAYWREKLGIRPDENGQYWEGDRQALEGLVEALKAGWTIERYKQKLLEVQQNADRFNEFNEQQQQRQDSWDEWKSAHPPIEITATAV